MYNNVYLGPVSLLGTLNYILLLGKQSLPAEVETEVKRMFLEPEGAREEIPNDKDLRDIALAWNFII